MGHKIFVPSPHSLSSLKSNIFEEMASLCYDLRKLDINILPHMMELLSFSDKHGVSNRKRPFLLELLAHSLSNSQPFLVNVFLKTVTDDNFPPNKILALKAIEQKLEPTDQILEVLKAVVNHPN